MKLLLVDDHPLIQDAFKYLVRELGPDATLLQATSAEDGLALSEQVDLLLLDLSLPGLSGLSALETFRSRRPELPIVVIPHRVGWQTEDEVREGAERSLPQLLERLTGA